MKNIVCINAINLTEYAQKSILGGKSAFESAILSSLRLPDVEKVFVLASTGTRIPIADQRLVVESKDNWSLPDLLGVLSARSEGSDAIFYFFGDSPFIDPDLSEKMHANHVRYYADYSFADGYPHGLAPEIISPRIVNRLIKLSEKTPPVIKRESIFDIIKKDINSFDVETELSPTDMRFLRAHLFADKKRNFLLLERIVRLGNTDSRSIIENLRLHPGILKTLPSFFTIQITERCPYPCSYCPYPKVGKDITKATGEMELGRFEALLGKIAEFSGDAYIDISAWGDPVYHSRLTDIVAACIKYPGIELVIETSGVGYEPALLESIARAGDGRITWIVSLDASKKEIYEQLRGKGFDDARATTDKLFELFPGKVFVQAVRMKDNEEDVELFYNYWKTRTENIIIQKYDHFSSFLPEKKITDLSPITRLPCWHVKRDMTILLDGTVPLCKEDLGVSVKLGNVFEEELSTIWERGDTVYKDHIAKNYSELCKKCDEYYTFNF
jgi:spiro-SPASM protein